MTIGLIPTYCFVRAIQKRSVWRVLFWTPIFLLGWKAIANSIIALDHIVISLQLKQNGKQAVAYFVDGRKFVFNIDKCTKNSEKASELLERQPQYFPISIVDEDGDPIKVLLFNHEVGTYPQGKAIFKAIINGHNVNTSGCIQSAPEAEEEYQKSLYNNRISSLCDSVNVAAITTILLTLVLMIRRRMNAPSNQENEEQVNDKLGVHKEEYEATQEEKMELK